MKKIVLSQYVKNNFNAGPKAKVDVETILNSEFNMEIQTFNLENDVYTNKMKRYISIIKKYFFTKKIEEDVDLTILQSPYTNQKFIYNNIKNRIIFIHDIEGLRYNNDKILEKEIELYKSSKCVIVHNNKMKDFLMGRGLAEKNIYVLEMFDYLCNYNRVDKEDKIVEQPVIIYTGNLDKAPFLKELDNDKMDFQLNVYGVCNNIEFNKKICYKGKFPPDEIVNNIDGDLGLVWDGCIDESDENSQLKNYTKFNNPHKLSCYLAAGIPVIVWKKSAVADFVVKYNIGYTINNLYDINRIDFNDYNVKKENAMKTGEKVREGYYTIKVLNEVLDSMKNNDK